MESSALFLSQRTLRLLILSGLVAALALLGGCASDGPSRSTRQQPSQLAEQLANQGDYNGAASRYLQQAQGARGDQASAYLIQASHYYALAGQTEQAKQTAARIDPAKLSQPLRVSWTILQAQLTLLRGDPQQANDMIKGIRSVPRPSAAWIWLVRADIADAQGQPMRALPARVELDRQLTSGTRKQANEDRLWRSLQSLSDPQLQQLGGAGAVLAGWAALAQAYRNAPPDTAGLRQAIADWQARHATHPAAKGFSRRLADQSQQLSLQLRQVAVLLPAQGRYAAPADAVRDGIVASWQQQPAGERPELRFYDVPEAAAQVTAVYRSAVAAGADAVIGPLRKEAIAALVNAGAITVPTLALNRMSTAIASPAPAPAPSPAPATADGQLAQPARPAPPRQAATIPAELYQFGLAPEDEAYGAAKQAAADGLYQAVALAPVGAKGDRIIAAFQRGLDDNGGVLLEQRRYDTGNESPFTGPIKSVLNLDASASRRKKLENLLGENLEFEPATRSDVDYVFLYARPVNARQIIPQLAFFDASGLPIYATADAFDGVPNRDVEGLVYPTMPWQSAADQQLSYTRLLLKQYRRDQFASFDRLYALGIDAYRVLPRLPQLRGFSRQSIDGASGHISVTPSGTVTRDPMWARVRYGKIDFYTLPIPLAAATLEDGMPLTGDGASDESGTGDTAADALATSPPGAAESAAAGTALAPPSVIRSIDPDAAAIPPGATQLPIDARFR